MHDFSALEAEAHFSTFTTEFPFSLVVEVLPEASRAHFGFEVFTNGHCICRRPNNRLSWEQIPLCDYEPSSV